MCLGAGERWGSKGNIVVFISSPSPLRRRGHAGSEQQLGRQQWQVLELELRWGFDDRVEAEPRAEPRWLMPICEPRVETDGAFGDKRLCMRCPEGSASDRHESRLRAPLVGEHVPTQCSGSFACGGG